MIQQFYKLNIGYIAIRITILYVTLAHVTYADNEYSNKKEEKQFPHNILIEYNNEQFTLNLTGLTIRRKFFLNIYSMAHYIEHKPNGSEDKIYKNILHHNTTKQISIIFMRSLTAEQIHKSLISGMKLNSTKEEFQKVQSQVKEFTHAIDKDVKQEDKFIIRWLPDGTLVSIFQGKKISTIKNDVFARILWSIWFSKDSVVDRKSLIRTLISNS